MCGCDLGLSRGSQYDPGPGVRLTDILIAYLGSSGTLGTFRLPKLPDLQVLDGPHRELIP